jgi:membrane-associated protease RseP (regulator of RpoE activity)
LFVLTLVTTTLAGAIQQGVNPLSDPTGVLDGLPFAITFMTFLGFHEMGHFLASKWHGVRTSYPLFIPAPTLLGTFGAFIRMRGLPPSRSALLDIGAAGPLCGLAIALPIWLSELHRVKPEGLAVPYPQGYGIELGNSLLVWASSHIIFGDGEGVFLTSVGFAAWIGFFVTCLNLLPIGQLDGGHILYALLGRYAQKLSLIFWVGLIACGLLWEGWLFWALLLTFLGVRHPRSLILEAGNLGPGRKLLGWFVLLVFVLCFVPVPFH